MSVNFALTACQEFYSKLLKNLVSCQLHWLWICLWIKKKESSSGGFPSDLMVKYLPSNAGNMGSIPGQGTETPQATKVAHCNYWARTPQLEKTHPHPHTHTMKIQRILKKRERNTMCNSIFLPIWLASTKILKIKSSSGAVKNKVCLGPHP